MKKDESRVYIIPLRKNTLKVPTWRRSNRAISEIKKFLLRHTKADRLVIGKWINEEVWKHGGKNPPGKIKVKVTLKEEGEDKVKEMVAHAELETLSTHAARVEKVEEKKKTLREKLKEKFSKKKEDAPEEVKEEKKEEKEQAKMSKEQELKMNQ